MPLALADLVATWEGVRAASGRIEKRKRMASLFSGLEPDDLRLAACYLAGEIPQVTTGVGWSLLSEAFAHAGRGGTVTDAVTDTDTGTVTDTDTGTGTDTDTDTGTGTETDKDTGTVTDTDTGTAPSSPPAPAPSPASAPSPGTPTLADVDSCFTALAAVSGPGANRRRVSLLGDLLAHVSPAAAELLGALLLGELRQGALRALVLEAVAAARGLDVDDLRRAVMYAGELGAVMRAVAVDGAEALPRFQLTPLIPVEPMLAATAESLEAALVDLGGTAALEWKLDGVRVQLHRRGAEVRAFTRSLREISEGAAELRGLALALPAESFILDGEMLSFHEGRPMQFQDIMSRFQTEGGSDAGLQVFFFDLLYLDGVSLVDRPDHERRAALEGLVGARAIPRTIVASAAEAQAALDVALAQGHEGGMLKALDAVYTAGRRGGLWRKLKPAHTLDLVILAAEWGHGRRRGWLSNLHLGARDPQDPTRFWMLGKTFKGLTDAMLRELTTDLRPLAIAEDEHVVRVRPERVVEIAFDGVQRSTRYDSGMALRFARVKRFRFDKRAADATTLDEIRALARRAPDEDAG